MPKEKNPKSINRNKEDSLFYRMTIGVVLLIILIVFAFVPIPQGTGSGTSRWITMPQLDVPVRNHFPAVVGLPLAALLSLWIVLILRGGYGPIELSVLGFRFRGASGPIIMWVLCFLAITFAIKILW